MRRDVNRIATQSVVAPKIQRHYILYDRLDESTACDIVGATGVFKRGKTTDLAGVQLGSIFQNALAWLLGTAFK
jgi:hypothetical protein